MEGLLLLAAEAGALVHPNIHRDIMLLPPSTRHTLPPSSKQTKTQIKHVVEAFFLTHRVGFSPEETSYVQIVHVMVKFRQKQACDDCPFTKIDITHHCKRDW